MSNSVWPHRQQPTRLPHPWVFQARTLEWVAISFSNAWKWKVKVKSLSRVRLFVTPWTAAYQAPLPMGFSRQEYWSGVPSLTRDEHKSKAMFTSMVFRGVFSHAFWVLWTSEMSKTSWGPTKGSQLYFAKQEYFQRQLLIHDHLSTVSKSKQLEIKWFFFCSCLWLNSFGSKIWTDLNSSGSKTWHEQTGGYPQVFLSQYKYSCISLQKYYSDYGCQLSSYQGCYVI